MSNSKRYDFLIADLNGRFDCLLGLKEYKYLIQSSSLDDLIVRINSYIPFINEDMECSIKTLKMKLFHNIQKEMEEFQSENCLEIDYLKDFNFISLFFDILETGCQNIEANSINELKCLLTYKNFDEIYKLGIEGSRIEKYFLGVAIKKKIEENDLQRMKCEVIRNYFNYYSKKIEGRYLKEILETEGDKNILEICINSPNLKNKYELFPSSSTFSEAMKEKLKYETSPNRIKSIININTSDPLKFAMNKLLKVYSKSFSQYNDSSCIVGYFKLKEIEARNIIWIAECIVQNNTEHIKECLLVET